MMSKKVIALDFDGVISDSAKGWALFSKKAWKKMGNNTAPPLAEIKKYRPYIKDAKDSYGLIVLLSRKSHISRELVEKEAAKNPERAQRFSDAFFREKDTCIKNNKEKFCELYGPFKFIIQPLREIAKKERTYIVTSNKKRQITDVLRKNKISIKKNNILDSSISSDKKTLLKIIAERENIDMKDILFIEDSVEHIKDAMTIGIQAALASWGYVIKEDLQEAKRLGVKVISASNFEKIIRSI